VKRATIGCLFGALLLCYVPVMMWMTSSVCESDLPSHHLLSDSIHCTGYDAASSMAHLLRSGSEHRGHFQPAKAKGPKIPYHLHKRHRAGWTEVFVAVGRLVPERFLVEASPPISLRLGSTLGLQIGFVTRIKLANCFFLTAVASMAPSLVW